MVKRDVTGIDHGMAQKVLLGMLLATAGGALILTIGSVNARASRRTEVTAVQFDSAQRLAVESEMLLDETTTEMTTVTPQKSIKGVVGDSTMVSGMKAAMWSPREGRQSSSFWGLGILLTLLGLLGIKEKRP